MKTLTVMLLCLMLCFTGVSVPEVSGAVLTTSIRTALVACLQQEYLMRDAYQSLYTRYPTLAALETVATSEDGMIVALKKLFAKYRITVPIDTMSSAAQTIADTVTCITGADAAALNLEGSTAALMARLLQTTRNTDVTRVIALIKATSLGSHTAAFAAEQASVSMPSPTLAIPTQHVVAFTPSQAAGTFLTLLGDMSVDVIELDGTYHLPYMIINIERTRPIVVRPVEGATVILSGANTWTDPQFGFGFAGVAGNITMQGLIFDGFVLGQQGIIQARDCHNITLNDMIVRNSRANGAYAQPYHAWAIYLDSNSTAHPTNFTANRWTVDGSARGMSAFTVSGGSHITATGWSVAHAYYAMYANPKSGEPLTDFVLDGWTISDTGGPTWGAPNVSVAIENTSGRFSNMHGVSSGILLNMGRPKMIDGGGNSF